MAPRTTCRVCGERAATPLVMGYPSAPVREAAERGEVVLGGCVIRDPTQPWPDTACTACGAQWASDEGARLWRATTTGRAAAEVQRRPGGAAHQD